MLLVQQDKGALKGLCRGFRNSGVQRRPCNEDRLSIWAPAICGNSHVALYRSQTKMIGDFANFAGRGEVVGKSQQQEA